MVRLAQQKERVHPAQHSSQLSCSWTITSSHKNTSAYPTGPKRPRHVVNAVSSVPCLYAAFQINSSHTLDFLVDTGASLSLLPLRFSRHFSVVPSAVKLSSVEGKAVPVHGECLLTIGSKDLRRSYKWCFVIADIANAIIGADFLAAHKLSVSCSRATLTDDVTGLIAACKSCSLSSFAPILAVPASQPVAQLLSEFSSVL